MANIRHLIEENATGSDVLRLAGELGARSEQEVYAVGGYVRDLFLGRDIKEIDFMVVGDGIKFARALADELKVDKIVPFQRFSTARIPYKKIPLEVASARTESYDDSSRKPDKIQYTDLKEIYSEEILLSMPWQLTCTQNALATYRILSMASLICRKSIWLHLLTRTKHFQMTP